MKKKKVFQAMLSLLLLMGISSSVFAKAGTPIIGVPIGLEGDPGSFRATSNTDDNGEFTFKAVAGNYILKLSYADIAKRISIDIKDYVKNPNDYEICLVLQTVSSKSAIFDRWGNMVQAKAIKPIIITKDGTPLVVIIPKEGGVLKGTLTYTKKETNQKDVVAEDHNGQQKTLINTSHSNIRNLSITEKDPNKEDMQIPKTANNLNSQVDNVTIKGSGETTTNGVPIVKGKTVSGTIKMLKGVSNVGISVKIEQKESGDSASTITDERGNFMVTMGVDTVHVVSVNGVEFGKIKIVTKETNQKDVVADDHNGQQKAAISTSRSNIKRPSITETNTDNTAVEDDHNGQQKAPISTSRSNIRHPSITETNTDNTAVEDDHNGQQKAAINTSRSNIKHPSITVKDPPVGSEGDLQSIRRDVDPKGRPSSSIEKTHDGLPPATDKKPNEKARPKEFSGKVISIDTKAKTYVVNIEGKEYPVLHTQLEKLPKIGSIVIFALDGGKLTAGMPSSCEECNGGCPGVCFMTSGGYCFCYLEYLK